MRIKLITFAPHPNFGTCLQSYALNTVLRQMGHDVEFIYNCRETPPPTVAQRAKALARWVMPAAVVERIQARRRAARAGQPVDTPPPVLALPDHPMLLALSRLPGYAALRKAAKFRTRQWRKVWRFTFEDGNFRMHRIYTHAQYKEVAANTDLFVTGSDQIWNPYCGGFNPMMFVEFGGDVRRIAYSSSLSQPAIHPSVRERMRADLARFAHIGVREQRTVDLLNELLGRDDVRLVLDPTFLLTRGEWSSFGDRADLGFTPPRRYIFCYFVGDERRAHYERMVEAAMRHTGISEVITLECYGRRHAYGHGRLCADAGPYEWVHLLEHAGYVCADSFHATVFAMKFRKDFVHALKNDDSMAGSQNTRMYDLLGRYGLTYKIFREGGEWTRPVDYAVLEPKLETDIADSLGFLKHEITE